MHGGYSNDDDDKPKRDRVDSAIIREKVKLARSEKWRILKNIVTVSVAFMVQFTAFQVSSPSLSIEGNCSQSICFREQQTYNRQSMPKTHWERSR